MEVVMPRLSVATGDDVLTVKERVAARKAADGRSSNMARIMRGRMGDGQSFSLPWDLLECMLIMQASCTAAPGGVRSRWTKTCSPSKPNRQNGPKRYSWPRIATDNAHIARQHR